MKRPMDPFITRLDVLMRERGLSQSELARKANMHQTAISRYLDPGPGNRKPTPASMAKIAVALAVDPAWEFIEYRRWLLHRSLDEWIDRDEDAVEFLLARLRPGQGHPA